jgi:hypothetical protein
MAARFGPWLFALAASLTHAADAGAEPPNCHPADGLSTCIAADQLWTHAGTGPWFSQAATVLPPRGALHTRFTAAFVRRSVGLRVASPNPDGTTIYAVDHVLGGQFAGAFGIHRRAAMSLVVPFVIYQEGAGKADIVGSDEELPHHAMGDLRWGTHISLLAGHPRWPAIALRFEMSLPTGDSDAFASSPSAGFAPGMSLHKRLGRFSLGGDVGCRLRREAELAGSLVGSDITTSLGGAFALLGGGKLDIGLEAFARISLLEQTRRVVHPVTSEVSYRTADQHLVPAEWLLSLRSGGWYNDRLDFAIAGGSFIPTGASVPVTAPAARVMASVSLASP